MQNTFIFGGNTGESYESLQRKRRMAEALLANRPRKITNLGEGINSAASSIAAALLGRRADKEEAAQREEFERRMYGGGTGSTRGYGGAPKGESRVDVGPMGGQNQPPASGTEPPSAPMSRGTDPMDPRRGMFPTEARAEYSGMADIDFSLGPKRPEMPGSEIQIAARRAAAEVFGPGSRVEVYSGTGDYGSPRHRQGDAADVRIYDPEGNLVSVNDPRVTDFAQAFARAGGQGFGAGPEYMGEHGFHLDVYPRDQYTSSMGPAWGSVGNAVEAQFVGTQPGSDPVPTGTGLEGYTAQELRQLAASPYASDFDRQLIQAEMNARVEANQPMSEREALELEQLRIETARMRNPEPEPGYTMLSPDEELQMGLDPEGSYQRGPDGRITSIGGGGQEINVGGESETAFQKETGQILAKEAGAIVDAGMQAQRGLGQILMLEDLLSRAPQGTQGALTQFAGNLGISLGEGADDVQAANAIINQLVPQQRPPGSGEMSNADVAMFRQSVPRLINQPNGNQLIIDTMKAIMEYDVARANIARRQQLGQINAQQAYQEYMSLGNPLAGFVEARPEGNTGGETGSYNATPAQISAMTDEQFDEYVRTGVVPQ